MYEKIEQLVNSDYNNRGIDKLYAAARARSEMPIIQKIAEAIRQVPAGSFVFLATGSVTRSWVTTSIGETDGPLGTAVLAKRIRELTSAIPVIFTEKDLVPSIKPVVSAAGLCVVSLEQAKIADRERARGQTSVACVLPFPEDDAEASLQARKLIAEMSPAMVISIEKAGFNEAGIYHNMRGHDFSFGRARIDYLVEEAKRANIATVGIGDGGNEIGMGAILPAVRQYVKYGAECQCGCGKGIAAVTSTDILLTGSVSNWACYAVCAALAMATGNAALLHTSRDEQRLLNTAIGAGMVDGATGKADLTVDGFSMETNCALVDFMHHLALKTIRKM